MSLRSGCFTLKIFIALASLKSTVEVIGICTGIGMVFGFGCGFDLSCSPMQEFPNDLNYNFRALGDLELKLCQIWPKHCPNKAIKRQKNKTSHCLDHIP